MAHGSSGSGFSCADLETTDPALPHPPSSCDLTAANVCPSTCDLQPGCGPSSQHDCLEPGGNTISLPAGPKESLGASCLGEEGKKEWVSVTHEPADPLCPQPCPVCGRGGTGEVPSLVSSHGVI